MALSVVNNVASLNAQNNLNRANNTLSKSLERLSTGLKINRGADGPAALVISERQRAQIAGLQTAVDNTSKAVSLVQTGEGALNTISSLLNKARSLALDSANAGAQDRDSLAANQAELANVLTTIDNIANSTQFGNQKLLDGSASVSGEVRIGDAAKKQVSQDVSFVSATPTTKSGNYEIKITTAAEKAAVAASQKQEDVLARAETLSINGVQVNLDAGLSQAQVAARINEFSSQTGVAAAINAESGTTLLTTIRYGSAAKIVVQSSAEASVTSTGFGKIKQSDAGVDIAGTIGGQAAIGNENFLTVATGDAAGLRLAVQGQADAIRTVSGDQGTVTVKNNALTFQIGANVSHTASVALAIATTKALGTGSSRQFDNLGAIDLTNSANAGEALKVIDHAINQISSARGELGAFQANTLESNATNLREALANVVAAESTIRDTDFAAEIAKFTKTQVVLQAGQTVLSNANQIPTLVASLLRG